MSQPNIVLINCDDLGYGDLGCYGSTVNSTPALDRLAAEGVRFTDFYMASAVCSPSRGAMMTGCYPPRIGFDTFTDKRKGVLFPGDDAGLNPNETTIAAVLKKAGYATRLIGKWHCGDQPEFLPTRHGFDGYYGLPYSNDMGRQGGGRDQMPPLPLLRDETVIEQQPDQASITERYLEDAVTFIRANRERPFFLYFAHMYVHLPIYVQERFMRETKNGSYGGAVASIDWAMAVILDELRRQGLDENTLVVFTSDNGSRGKNGGSNAPLRGAKASTWEGGIRLPCIMRWPAAIPAGVVCRETVASIDFFRTFAGIAGATAHVPTDRILDSLDLGELLRAPATAKSPRETFFYYGNDRLEAVRHGKWKLHVWKARAEIRELYDLVADPGESVNQIDAQPAVVAELEALLAACRIDLGDGVKGVTGRNRRPAGKVENAKPLTNFDPNHPYYIAMYDLTDVG